MWLSWFRAVWSWASYLNFVEVSLPEKWIFYVTITDLLWRLSEIIHITRGNRQRQKLLTQDYTALFYVLAAAVRLLASELFVLFLIFRYGPKEPRKWKTEALHHSHPLPNLPPSSVLLPRQSSIPILAKLRIWQGSLSLLTSVWVKFPGIEGGFSSSDHLSWLSSIY